MGILGDVVGGLGGFIGGIAGNGAASDEQKKAQQALLDAINTWKNADVQAGPSAAASMDPAGRDAQIAALSRMQNVYQTGGLTEQDRVAQEQAMEAAAQQEQAQRGAITQEAAARGQLGGGAELAARLSGAQSTAQASHMAGAQAAGNAQQRALQAMMASGQMGGQIRTGDLSQASAQDLMSRFNAGQRTVQTGGIAGGQGALGGYFQGDAQRIRNQYTGMGQGLGNALGGGADAAAGAGWLGQGMQSWEQAKKPQGGGY